MMAKTLIVPFMLSLIWAAEAAAQGRQTLADAAVAGRAFKDCPICPEMVIVPAGEFVMGSPDNEKNRGKNEGPLRTVSMQVFAAGKFEVTFEQWDACVAEGGCSHKPVDQGWGRGRRPVLNISWEDAKQYVAWLSKRTSQRYRLLTEAEWEYAARGVTKATDPHTPFSTGPTINYKQANYDANFTYNGGGMGIYRQKTSEVGSFRRNPFGLHDMHGNVWEWVEDCYKDSYAGAPTDGSAVVSSACSLRIARGGAWNYLPTLLRSAYRYATAGNVRLENIGLRVARAM